MKNISIVMLSLAVFFAISSSQAQVSCLNIHNPSRTFSKSLLEIQGSFLIQGVNFNGKLSEISKDPLVVQALAKAAQTKKQIQGVVAMPNNLGGGHLRLISLDLGNNNRAYNHQELAALLKIHPELMARIGFFKVDGYENLVWAPDITQMNYRLKRFSQENRTETVTWGYEPAEGVVAFEPYSQLLARGKFPFSNDQDVNLSVHDVMHSIAFAITNSVPQSRQVMEAALVRNKAVFDIHARLKAEIPELAEAFEASASQLASDPMERTMLLTILMTGNYGYFSPSTSRAAGRIFELQNQEITEKRVENLLRFYVSGGKNFKSVMEPLLLKISADKVPVLKAIFREAVESLVSVDDKTYESAAKILVKQFFPKEIFSDAASVQKAQKKAGSDSAKFDGSYGISLGEVSID